MPTSSVVQIRINSTKSVVVSETQPKPNLRFVTVGAKLDVVVSNGPCRSKSAG